MSSFIVCPGCFHSIFFSFDLVGFVWVDSELSSEETIGQEKAQTMPRSNEMIN